MTDPLIPSPVLPKGLKPNRRYCEMCDEWFPLRKVECPKCGMPMQAHAYCAACDREGATAGGDTTPVEYHACRAGERA